MPLQMQVPASQKASSIPKLQVKEGRHLPLCLASLMFNRHSKKVHVIDILIMFITFSNYNSNTFATKILGKKSKDDN